MKYGIVNHISGDRFAVAFHDALLSRLLERHDGVRNDLVTDRRRVPAGSATQDARSASSVCARSTD